MLWMSEFYLVPRLGGLQYVSKVISAVGSWGWTIGIQWLQPFTIAELLHVRNALPDNVIVQRIDERLSALGNTIATNDHVALIHPEIDRVSKLLLIASYFCSMNFQVSYPQASPTSNWGVIYLLTHTQLGFLMADDACCASHPIHVEFKWLAWPCVLLYVCWCV